MWVCPSYGWRCWGVSRTGVVAADADGGWRSTSLRERDCLAREEPRRREGWRSTRALSLRATFLLWGGRVRVRDKARWGHERRGGKNATEDRRKGKGERGQWRKNKNRTTKVWKEDMKKGEERHKREQNKSRQRDICVNYEDEYKNKNFSKRKKK